MNKPINSARSRANAPSCEPSSRDRLLDAAAVILERDGLAGMNTNALAREAELTVPTVYRKFKNKEDVLVCLARRFIVAEAALLSDAAMDFDSAPSVQEAANLVIDSYWAFARKHRGIVPLRAAMRVWPELRPIEEESLEHSAQWLAKRLANRYPGLSHETVSRVSRYLVETVCATVDRCYPLGEQEQLWRLDSLKQMMGAYLAATLAR